MFYVLLTLVFILPLLLLYPTLSNRSGYVVDDQESQNAHVARERIGEILGDSTSGDEAGVIRSEVEQALASDLAIADNSAFRFMGLKVVSAFKSFSLVVPVLAAGIGVYLYTGAPELGTGKLTATQQQPADETSATVEELLAQLEARLEQEPDSIRGWELAASTYMSLQNFTRAEQAYNQLNRLVPGNPDYLSGWADALILGNGNQYTAEAREKIAQALSVDPGHVNALWISGLGELSLGNTARAISRLNTLAPLLAENPEAQSQVLQLIADASGGLATSPETQPSNESAVNAAMPERTVTVELSLDDDAQIDPNTTVFLVARAINGPPAPVAVRRLISGELPGTFQLDRSLAMVPGHDIDSYEQINVSARLSLSGEATPRSGDLVSDTLIIDFADAADGNNPLVHLSISKPVP